MFEIVPAVDLKAGRCVRLLQGRADAETVFSDDPVAMARRWEASGARRLHVVDLDGAFAGGPAQTDLVRAMVSAVSIPVEVGGGLPGVGEEPGRERFRGPNEVEQTTPRAAQRVEEVEREVPELWSGEPHSNRITANIQLLVNNNR